MCEVCYGIIWEEKSNILQTIAHYKRVDENNTQKEKEITLSYDKAGNIIGDSKHIYTYDAKNRLVKIDNNITYTYNYKNQRVSKTVNNKTTYFIYDDYKLIGEYNEDGTVIKEYIYLDDTPIAILENNKVYYIYADHLNTPRRVATSEDNTIVWKWESKPFGENKPTGTYTLNLRFPGQYFDKESSFSYNINRCYNPSLGRYMQSDPIGLDGGENSYLYGNANSLRYVDEKGLYAKIEYYGNYVRITVPIAFVGVGATSSTISKFKNGIERYWSGKFGSYTVQTIVALKPLGIAENTIQVPVGNGRPFVNFPMANNGVWPQETTSWQAAHETGHLMGLDDRYKDNSAGISIPEPGWSNNIMGKTGQYVQARNIEEILQNPKSINDILLQSENFRVEAGINIISIILIYLITMLLGLLQHNIYRERK